MTKMTCFSALLGGKKKQSKAMRKVADAKEANGHDSPKVIRPVEFVDTMATAGVSKYGEMAPTRDTEVVADAVAEAALEGGNENDGKASMKRDLSGFDLPARTYSAASDSDNAAPEKVLACEQVSGSCVGHMAPAGLPKLKRSCSNIETTRSSPKASGLPARSRSYDDLEHLPASLGTETTPNVPAGSPASVKTSCTADRVMLKKRSSSQLLPSRSRKLWWRLFLWSHRNLHRPWTTKPTTPSLHNADASVSQQHDGYTSDTLDVGPAMADRKNKKVAIEDTPIPNQWVAFSAEASSLDRVSAWVNSLENGSFHAEEEDDMEHEDGVVRVRCTKVKESSGKNIAQARRHGPAEEVFQANSIIQTLNTFSSVAHISGMGLKAVPMISAFSSLRAVNLSSNFIVRISPGSLPKGLHSLDLSRNNIANIEGLRELTRLRVLNLSYNRISRIGYGLSNCTAIKELFLAGNKISDVEGLHRMLKLTVLDLSFNKITTTKALGQLVANYNSLLALNLLGNPIQSNISDDALRKAASGLLPRLTYLNKQPIKPQRVREVATDSVAKAALGNSGRSSRRRLSRRLSQSPGSSVKGRGGEGSRSRSKSRHQSSSLTRK